MTDEAFKLDTDPFDWLDAYTEESITWAKRVIDKIDTTKLKEKDPIIISAALANIFNLFIHVSMRYLLSDFESYFDEFEDKIPNAWKRMHVCMREICLEMHRVYGDDYQVYLTLYNAILIKDIDESSEADIEDLIEPYDYDEMSGYSFVENGFSY